MNLRFPSFDRLRPTERIIRSALLAGAVIPLPSVAQVPDVGDQQRAEGIALEVSPGDYSTRGNNKPVFVAIDGGTLTTAGKTRLFSFGHGSAGAAAEGPGSRIELRDAEIRTRGIFATGIDARRGGSVLASHISVDTDNDSAHGAYVDGAGSRIDLADSLIVTRGREAHGIAVHYAPGAVVNVDATRVLTGGEFSYGAFVSDDGTRATFTRTEVHTTGDYSSALFMPGASTATFNGARLPTDGFAALGVDTRKGSVELTSTQVLTQGRSAHGLYASKEYTETPVVRATDTHVETTGAKAVGAIARLGGRIELRQSSISTHGNQAYAVLSGGAGSIASLTDTVAFTTGEEANALDIGYGGRVDMLRSDVLTKGERAWGASVRGATLNVDGGSLVSERHGALEASNATLSLTNGARVAGGNGTLLSVIAQSDAPVRLSLDTGSRAEGDIVNHPTDDGSPTHAVTDVKLANGSAWTGATDVVRALSLDTNSRWAVTADSTVGSISLNDSTIAFTDPAAGAPATPRTLVVTGDYAARNGRLVLHTTLQDDASPTDRLVIDGGHVSGDTGIVVKRSGGDGAPTTIGIPLVETRNGGTTDASAFTLDSASDGYRKGFGTLSAGGYDYMLKRGGDGGQKEDWYLVSAAKPVPPEPPGPVDPDPSVKPEITPPPRAVAPEPDAYLANADAASTMAIHTLHQREDRSLRTDAVAAGPLDGAVWLRAEGQMTSMSGGSRSVSGNGRLVHAGADLFRFSDGRGGSVRVGAMGMYGSQTNWSTRPLWNATEQRMANATARGSVSGYNVGVYGTWYGSRDILSGPYVDAWFMYGAYANSVGGSLAADSYRSRTLTGSLETGYSMPFYERGDSRFFVEPEVQFVVSDYHADAHAAPGGRIDGQGATDVLTRVGVRVHGVTAMPHGRELRPFVEANWWHGPGSRALTLDGNAFSFSVPRDRAAVRIGATGQLSRRFSVSASVGVEGNLSDYSVVRGQLSAKYRW